MTSPIPAREPWDDHRLEAAFAARASRTPLPTELVGEVVARARTADPPMAVWRRWLPAAAVVVLTVGVVAGGSRCRATCGDAPCSEKARRPI